MAGRPALPKGPRLAEHVAQGEAKQDQAARRVMYGLFETGRDVMLEAENRPAVSGAVCSRLDCAAGE